jgi:hypothetical protein
VSGDECIPSDGGLMTLGLTEAHGVLVKLMNLHGGTIPLTETQVGNVTYSFTT